MDARARAVLLEQSGDLTAAAVRATDAVIGREGDLTDDEPVHKGREVEPSGDLKGPNRQIIGPQGQPQRASRERRARDDNGTTWSKLGVLYSDKGDSVTINNPAPVFVGGRILVVFCRQYSSLLALRSNDALGDSWPATASRGT